MQFYLYDILREKTEKKYKILSKLLYISMQFKKNVGETKSSFADVSRNVSLATLAHGNVKLRAFKSDSFYTHREDICTCYYTEVRQLYLKQINIQVKRYRPR